MDKVETPDEDDPDADPDYNFIGSEVDDINDVEDLRDDHTVSLMSIPLVFVT